MRRLLFLLIFAVIGNAATDAAGATRPTTAKSSATRPAAPSTGSGPRVKVHTINDTTITGEAIALTDKGVLVVKVTGEKNKVTEEQIPLDTIVELTPPVKGGIIPATLPKPSTQSTSPIWAVSLITGDSFHGVIGTWDEKELTLDATVAGGRIGLAVPVGQLQQMWVGTAEQIKSAKAMKLDAGPEDAAFVVKEGAVIVVRGVALGIDGQSLRFKFNDQERKIGLAKLVGVSFGGQEAKRDDSFRQSIELKDGESISGTWKTFQNGLMGIETAWGGKLLIQIPFTAVARVRGINGRMIYLSDLKPSRVQETPFFDRLMPWKADAAITGGPLKLVDGEHRKGLAVHSHCVLEYEIEGKYETFAAKVGFQQPEGRVGQAVVRVLGDGRVLYEDLDARGDAPKPADVSVKVGGVKALVLEVDFGKNEDTGDRVVWANARLLREHK